VQIQKAAILEEFVNRSGQRVAHAEYGAERIRSGAQVSEFAERLQRMLTACAMKACAYRLR
jgi:hypothetical protein